jgi:energy-coupling factor transporter ATP-binding protein EcfA2
MPSIGSSAPPAADLAAFRVILDEPAEAGKLGAGFDVYAGALADVVLQSKPHFAIGIFGDWGSGKTTLMKAIHKLVDGPETIPVWFNAWRYEKEEHLIVPLLDTLRADLLVWGKKHQHSTPARQAAKGIGRAARALAAGLSVTVGFPPVELGFDGSKALEEFKSKPADAATSFYFASFNELQTTLKAFFAGGARRIVVFIDDLDRCLPQSALEVLESMKLFFDLEGFVFVVGLDQGVIERSIEAKYQPTTSLLVLDRDSANGGTTPTPLGTGATAGGMPAPISGGDYVKKIFQVPFTLPRISIDDLDAFFGELLENASLPDEQQEHLREQLGAHLEVLSGKRAVNPRELKRMVNAYTIQAKMLGAKLSSEFDPTALVALLTIRFRADWSRVYEALAAEPDDFVEALKLVLEDTSPRVLDEPIPPDFLDYVKDAGARVLKGGLGPYISSVEATHAGDPTISEALTIARRLRASTAKLADDELNTALVPTVLGDISLLVRALSSSSSVTERTKALMFELDAAGSALSSAVDDPAARSASARQAQAIANQLFDHLRDLSQRTSTGATA